MPIERAAISAENTGTDWIDMSEVPSPYKLDLSLDVGSGTTIHLQRKRTSEAASAARDVQSFTADFEGLVEGVGKWEWRLFCKTGNYSAASTIEIESA